MVLNPKIPRPIKIISIYRLNLSDRAFFKMEIINPAQDKKYDVAVFVTSFNNAAHIKQAMNSILEQNFKKSFHIFVHDDASVDGTQSLLMEYANQFPELVTLILQSENQYSQGKPIGIDLFRYSNSEFIAYCEADDYWNVPTKLKIQYKFLDRYKFCAIVHSPVKILNDGGSIEYQEALQNHLKEFGQYEKFVSGDTLTQNNFIMTGSVMVRRKEIPELVLSDLGTLQPMDWAVFALATRFGSIGFINETLSTYRLHSQNHYASSNPVLKSTISDTLKFIGQYSPYQFTQE
jgi:glycosyltransferase involved in cell wall biosynthesis